MNWKESVLSVIDDWDGKHIVTSPDVDGILSALVVGLYTGASLTGVYTTRYYLGFDESCKDAARDKARNAIWLDHDISQLGIRCIGQHLVNHSLADKLPRRHPVSFNPNIFFGQAYPDSFKGRAGKTRDKYPFATVHFLMSALKAPEIKRGTEIYHLLAHADGSWGTCQDYPNNTRIWYDLMFDADDIVLTDLVCSDYCADQQNLSRHTRLVKLLKDHGIESRTSRESTNTAIPAAWQGLQGHQGITYRKQKDPNVWMKKFKRLVLLVSDLTGWKMKTLPSKITTVIPGIVEQPYPNSIRAGEFDKFMMDEKIFSHAIKSSRMLRYTKDLTI